MIDRYPQEYARYRWRVPDDFNIARATCRRWTAEGERVAVRWEDERGATASLSFLELQRAANRLSNALRALGIAAGDRVALILPQRPETVITYLAIFQMGAVAVPLSLLFGPEAIESRLVNSGAKVAVVDPQTLGTLWPIRAGLPEVGHVIGVAGARESGTVSWEDTLQRAASDFDEARTRATDPAAIIYTSGTTGSPKGALLAHRALLGNLPGFEYSHDGFPQAGDFFWSPADWAWTGGLWDALMPTLYHGQAILGYHGRFDAEKAFWLIDKYGVRHSFLFATALEMMVAAMPSPRRR